jgi:hypothetical protein
MKKFLLALLLLFIPLACIAGDHIQVWNPQLMIDSTKVTLDSTSNSTVYVTYVPIRASKKFSPSTTAPTVTSDMTRLAEWSATGDVGVAVTIDTSTAQESDSLAFWVKPLVYSKSKNQYEESTNDSTFLVFDTAGTYTSTSIDYLNWTHGQMYTTTLSGQLWPFAGFVLKMKSVANDNAGADCDVYIDIYYVQ